MLSEKLRSKLGFDPKADREFRRQLEAAVVVPRKKHPPQMRQLRDEMLRSGRYTTQEIHLRTGYDKDTITHIARKLKLTYPKQCRADTTPVRDAIRAHFEKNPDTTVEGVVAACRCSHDYAYIILKKLRDGGLNITHTPGEARVQPAARYEIPTATCDVDNDCARPSKLGIAPASEAPQRVRRDVYPR